MTTCVLTEVFALPLPYLACDIAATLKRKPTDVLQVSGTKPTELYLPAVCFLTSIGKFSSGELPTNRPSNEQTNVPYSTILPAR